MPNELYEKRAEQMFPRLSKAQIARLEPHGVHMVTTEGQVLIEPGDHERKMIVVLAGSLQITVPGVVEQGIRPLGPGDFAGEMSTLRGVPGFVRVTVREAGEVLVITDSDLRVVVQTDAELSEIFMRAFILRRMGLISAPNSEMTLIGSRYCGHTLLLREFLARNAHPHFYLDAEVDEEAEGLLQRAGLTVDDVPAVIGRNGRALRKASLRQVAEFLEINPEIDETAVHDLLVVGAGPAGLAGAVYAASEGLDVRVIDSFAPGGQAGTSSRIENYLGFPTGISGQALAGRALVQSQKFGARFNVACDAVALHCDSWPYRVEMADGRFARARTVLIATGAQYRKPELPNLQKYTGVGVYYAATHLEGKMCQQEEIIVVGGGNSAGQAAVFLAGGCRHVHIMVRADGLAETMSHYLIRRIEESPNITLHTRTQISALEGECDLERVTWTNARTGESETRPIRHVFLMTGAAPNTEWLKECVNLDAKGFVRTGADLTREELSAARWPMSRSPYLMETSLPGVFAVGDVRSGSVKRVASGVGEGSVCVQFVHRVLRELPAVFG
ncbi:FAD-dependent oxidoreductase [Steroidobacter sp. S1-65]|uniref:FAD-dependent oxidoreductase n=1 Tax=Steroidobacter gossypii TaxID=2805490 RepID=A0ABS1X208_9GAMM|nr:FAD-dependent oxidoreductase [Steroidobacter gossypii]MBM0107202.1 FAD-dependent oxidoreductase [Steroidobacter gossypii]